MRIPCANSECPNTAHTFREKLGFGASGETHNGLWYCSRACFFRQRAKTFIAAKKDGFQKTVRRVKLGLLLVKNNLIDSDTLKLSLEEQAQSGRRLGEILVNKKFIEPRDLKSVLSIQAGLAPVNLDPHQKIKLKDEIPIELLREFHFVCFRFDERERLIGIAVYDIELLSLLQELFAEVYPEYLARFYLDDQERILSILTAHYPGETFSIAADTPDPSRDNSIEPIVLKLAETLGLLGAADVKIVHKENKIQVNAAIRGMEVKIEVAHGSILPH